MTRPHRIDPDHSLVDDSEQARLRELFVQRMREVPGAVAIIATRHEGTRGGLAATAWCSLSADPPTVLVCVNRSASAHDAIVAARNFSVNQLATAHNETIAIFSAQRGLSGDARFLDGEWQEGKLGTPLLLSAVTAYECTVVGHLEYQTHSIFIGQVVEMLMSGKPSDPATYFRGALRGVGTAGA
jgi:flavin reductase (DIM6/NTAB) family NADH-FMN oxidoreductase RutF